MVLKDRKKGEGLSRIHRKEKNGSWPEGRGGGKERWMGGRERKGH